MIDTKLQVFVGIVLSVAFLGGIPYVIWITYTAYHRRWKRVALQIGLPLLAVALLWVVDVATASLQYANYLTGIFGTEVPLSAPLFEHHSPRHFNGDGYSFEVYHLPDGVRHWFTAANNNELADLPRRPDYRSHWRTQPWREGPLDPHIKEDVDFAFAYSSSTNPELAKYQADLRQALARPRTFYAYFAYDHSQTLGNIDLFVIDLDTGRLYLINLNT